MTETEFYKIIEENSINGSFIGFWTITLPEHEVFIYNVGSVNNDIFVLWSDVSELEERYYTLDEALDGFMIEGNPLKAYINDIEKMEVAEYID